jgi:triacylglycerol lipase
MIRRRVGAPAGPAARWTRFVRRPARGGGGGGGVRGRPAPRHYGTVSPRRRILLVAAAAVALVLLGVAGVRALIGRSSGPVDQARPGTVLLVPGFGGSRSALDRLAARLRAAGRTAVVITLPGDGTGDLIRQAATLDAAARSALGDGAPSIDVVGYSAGGVVTRIWVDRFGSADRARRIVTLGSPLHGARVAASGTAVGGDACPTACRQLAPGSDLLDGLDRTPLPAGLPWLSVWTENDETVRPPDSARLSGAVNVPLQSVCPRAQVSHGQLPTDPRVTALVFRGVAAAPLSAPTGCETVSS